MTRPRVLRRLTVAAALCGGVVAFNGAFVGVAIGQAGPGSCVGSDSDLDGVCDAAEVGDTDGDGTLDQLDTDDDGDGIPTISEGADPNGDANPIDAIDSDGDGTPDYLDPRHDATRLVVQQVVGLDAIDLGLTPAVGDRLGLDVQAVGDVDGNGVVDLAIGVPGDDRAAPDEGSVRIALMDADGGVAAVRTIRPPDAVAGAAFGAAIAPIGDLDGNGVTDLAIGAPLHDGATIDGGIVYVLLLDASGAVIGSNTIDPTDLGIAALDAVAAEFGASLAALGDHNGDGRADLAVGLPGYDDGGIARGGVALIALDSDGTIAGTALVAGSTSAVGLGLADGDRFGQAIVALGDADGDLSRELVVGTPGHDGAGADRGALHVLDVDPAGTVTSLLVLDDGDAVLGPQTADGDALGSSLAVLGDVSLDGVVDLAVGLPGADDGDLGAGAVLVVELGPTLAPTTATRLSETVGGIGTTAADDAFGTGLSGLGDLDGDGALELAVAAPGTGGDQGQVRLVSFERRATLTVDTTLDESDVTPGDGACVIASLGAGGATQCSLRAAIEEANTGTADTIRFEIPGGDPGELTGPPGFTIQPAAPLPTITVPLTIDAFTQDPASATPPIEVNGVVAATGDGLVATAEVHLAGLAIIGWTDSGISLGAGADQSSIDRTHVGVDRTGASVGNGADGIQVGAADVVIADTTVAANAGSGVAADTGADRLRITGSRIGVDPSGSAAAGNTGAGLDLRNTTGHVIGVASDGNVISANGAGILLDTVTDTTLHDNLVGLSADGVTVLGQGGVGVEVRNGSTGISIGGLAAGTANRIVGQGADGVTVDDSSNGVSVVGNEIHGNGGLALDLIDVGDPPDGVTPNDAGDADVGANDLLNRPELLRVDELGGLLHVRVGVDLPAGDYRIELFRNPGGADPSGAGEGEEWANAATITHPGGEAETTVALIGVAGDVITATVTELVLGEPVATSEFSDAATAVGDTDGDGLLDNVESGDTDGDTVNDVDDPDDDGDGTPTNAEASDPDGDGRPTDALDRDHDGQVDHLDRPTFPTLVEIDTELIITEGLVGYGESLGSGDRFGTAVTAIGDLDRNGVVDIAVGLPGYDDGGSNTGAVDVLLMADADTVLSVTRIAASTWGGGTFSADGRFGAAVERLADLDGDGRLELAVGSPGDDAIDVLFLAADGTVTTHRRIDASDPLLTGVISSGDEFGAAVAVIGDGDGNGVPDLAIGSPGADDGGTDRGAVTVLRLDEQGRPIATTRLAHATGGLSEPLEDGDEFGTSIVVLSEPTGSVLPGLAVGAPGTDGAGTDRGAVHLIRLDATDTAIDHVVLSSDLGTLAVPGDDDDRLGTDIAAIGDLDGDNLGELAITAPGDDDGGTDRGAIHVVGFDAVGAVRSLATLSASSTPPVGGLNDGDTMGAVAGLGDLDGDGAIDLVVGRPGDDTAANNGGSIQVLRLRPDPAPLVNSTGDAADTDAADGRCDTGSMTPTGQPECTLRAAIDHHDASAVSTTISFAIDSSDTGHAAGTWTIRPATPLPTITRSVVLDATSQPGAVPGTSTMPDAPDGVPAVLIDGSLLGAGSAGLTIDGPASVIDGIAVGNVGGIGSSGISLTAGAIGSHVRGSVIGLTPTGNGAAPIGGSSIRIAAADVQIGGSMPGDTNLIGFASASGIVVEADGVVIEGNLIGTDRSGVLDFGNAVDGIQLVSGDNARIGGTTAAQTNLISGNNGAGVRVEPAATGSSIEGNRIGTELDGGGALGNGVGIRVAAPTDIGGVAAGAGNLISGNVSNGITVVSTATGTRIRGNQIGTDTTGTAAVGNGGNGVAVNASSVTIGGVGTAEQNVIAHSALDNVAVSATATGVSIVGNSILGSGLGAGDIGIDLGFDGPTANDPGDTDTGANDALNHPELGTWTAGATTTVLQYDIDLPPGDYRIEFFLNPAGTDPAGVGEGQVFVGAAELSAHPGGPASHSVALPGTDFATATATSTERIDPTTLGSTSEFSPAASGTSNQPPVAAIVSPALGAEGAGVTLDASASTDPDGDPITAAWDLDNDGSFDDATGLLTTLTWLDLNALGIDDDIDVPIAVEIVDDNGNRDEISGTLSVLNVPPTPTIGFVGQPTAGEPFSIDLDAIDPGDDTITVWRVQWGDGTFSLHGGAAPTATHTYTLPGLVAPIIVEAWDEDGRWIEPVVAIPMAATIDEIAAVDHEAPVSITTFGGDGPLDGPGRGAIDTGGGLLVASFGTNSILRYDASGAFDRVVVPTTASPPLDVAVMTDGSLLVLSANALHRYDPATGAPLGQFASGFVGAEAVAIDPDGRPWVVDSPADVVRILDRTTGVEVAVANDFGTGANPDPTDVAVIDGQMMVTVAGLDRVVALDETGAFDRIVVSDGTGGLFEPMGLALGGDGRIWVTSTDDELYRFNVFTGSLFGSSIVLPPDFAIEPIPLADAIVVVQANAMTAVNSTADTDDRDPGDGRCDTGASITGGADECTLRAAIQEANAGSLDTIEFEIPADDPGITGGVARIEPATPLPGLVRAVEIDATTQAGATSSGAAHPATIDGRPAVELSGDATSGDGLTLTATADGSTVRGLSIGGFDGAAIRVDGADDVTLRSLVVGAQADADTLWGNTIGIHATDADRLVIGGPASADRSILLAPSGTAVRLDGTSTGNVIRGNEIGIDGSGTIRASSGDGVVVAGSISDTTIGGTSPDEPNRIAGFDRGVAILEDAGTPDGISMLGNRIWASTSLDLDLGGDGVDPIDTGDGDIGPNDRLNAPVLRIDTAGATSTTIAIDLDAPAGDYRVEVFANPSGTHPSGSGGAERLVGAVQVSHPGGQVSDAASIDVPLAVAAPTRLTATLTEEVSPTDHGNTSELSAAPVPPSAVVVNSTGDTDDNDPTNGLCHTGTTNADGNPECTLRAAITQANNNPNITTIHFDIPTNDPNHTNTTWTITPTTQLPTITTPITLDATTQPGHTTTPVIAIDGAAVAGNASIDGLVVSAADTTIRSLSIHGFGDEGLDLLAAPDVVVIGNWIGVAPDGTVDGNAGAGIAVRSASTGARVGGAAATDANVVADNNAGIRVEAAGVTVQRNRVGVLADGVTPAGNGWVGILVVGVDTAVIGNVIGDTAGSGINVRSTTGARITSNSIGIAADFSPVGNIYGVLVDDSSDIVIGGDLASDANLILYNTSDGVAVESNAEAAVIGNHIGANGGLAIDLELDGPTPNDPGDGDGGANDRLNHPEPVLALIDGINADVDFTLDVPAGDYRIDLFTNPLGDDPSGFGEATLWRASATITHAGAGPESHTLTTPAVLADRITLTATAIDAGGANLRTSEASAPVTAISETVVVNSTGDTDDNDPTNGLCHTGTTNADGNPECTLRAAITQANNNPNITTIHFDIPTNDPNHTNTTWTITPTTQLPTITTPITLDATTQPGHTTTPVIRPAIEVTAGSLAPTSTLIVIDADDTRVTGLSLTGTGSGGTAVGGNGDRITISGNVIGLSGDGVETGGLEGVGIRLRGADATVGGAGPADGNIIASLATGVLAEGSGHEISGNIVGLAPMTGLTAPNADGIVVSSSPGTTIGGPSSAQANLISANGRGLVLLGTAPAPVIGNLFGVTADGDAGPGNTTAIVVDTAAVTIGGAGAGEANHILNSAAAGIEITAAGSGFVVVGNMIGVAPDFFTPAGNAVGVTIAADGRLGGTTLAEGNLIVDSIGAGVVVADTVSDATVIGNSIYGSGGLDLDLLPLGSNDGLVGVTANGGLPAPTITEALAAAGTARLVIETALPAGDYRVEVFANTAAHPSGFGGGEFLTRATTITSTGGLDTHRLRVPGFVGEVLTATVTEETGASFGATSEFSAAIVTVEPPAVIVNTIGDESDLTPGDNVCDVGGLDVDGERPCSLRAAIEEANASSSVRLIEFAIPLDQAGADDFLTIRPTSSLPTVNADISIDGTTQNPVIAWSGLGATPPVVLVDGSLVNDPGAPALRLGDRTTVRGLGIGDVTGDGILIEGDDTVVAANWIGIRPDGASAPLAGNGIVVSGTAAGSVVGGDFFDDVNLIGRTNIHGIVVGAQTTDTTVRGNWIGVDLTGGPGATPDLDGIVVAGVASGVDLDLNVVLTPRTAIELNGGATDITITSNDLGVAPDGTVGGVGIGVRHASSGSATIGGLDPDTDNLIETWSDGAIVVEGPGTALVLGNRLVGDAPAIDLGNDGVDTNDVGDLDSGPNDRLNHPVISGAVEIDGASPPALTLTIDLDVPSGDHLIEVFRNDQRTTGAEQRIARETVTTTGGTSTLSIEVAGEPGDLLTASISDLGEGITSEFSAIVEAEAFNRAPSISITPTGGAEGDAISLVASASDPDGDDLTVAWDLDDDGLFDDGTGLTVDRTWSELIGLGITDDGSFRMSARVSDGQITRTASATLVITDRRPTGSLAGPTTAVPGQTLTWTRTTADPGNDPIERWIVDFGDGSIETFTGDITSVSHRYDRDGTYVVVFTLVDDNDLTTGPLAGVTVVVSTPTVVVTEEPGPVVGPPQAANDAYSTNEDTRIVVTAPGVLGNDVDPAAGGVIVTVVDPPDRASIFTFSDGGFVYRPRDDVFGTDEFTYRIEDIRGQRSTATVRIDITPVNDPPQLTGGNTLGGDDLSTLLITDPDPTGTYRVTISSDDLAKIDWTLSPGLSLVSLDGESIQVEGTRAALATWFDTIALDTSEGPISLTVRIVDVSDGVGTTPPAVVRSFTIGTEVIFGVETSELEPLLTIAQGQTADDAPPEQLASVVPRFETGQSQPLAGQLLGDAIQELVVNPTVPPKVLAAAFAWLVFVTWLLILRRRRPDLVEVVGTRPGQGVVVRSGIGHGDEIFTFRWDAGCIATTGRRERKGHLEVETPSGPGWIAAANVRSMDLR